MKIEVRKGADRYYVDGNEVAEIVKQFTFLFPRYSIEGLGWEIEGRCMAHDYEIRQGGCRIVRRNLPVQEYLSVYREIKNRCNC